MSDQVFADLLKAVKLMKEKDTMFKSTLADIRSILVAIKPVIKDIQQHNNDLGRPKEELQRLVTEMEKGTVLVCKCSKTHWWNYFARIGYQEQLEALLNSLVRYFTIEMQAQTARDQKETLLEVRKLLCKSGLSLVSAPVPADMTESEVGQGFKSNIRNGKQCCMLGARDLLIIWGDTPKYWSWTTLQESRFPEVAKLHNVRWLEIRGKINTRALSPDTQYAAYLVFKMGDDVRGFHKHPVNVSAGIPGERSCTRKVCLVPISNLEERKLHYGLKGLHRPNEREDGWLEIETGEFNSGQKDKEVEMSVTETESNRWKGGLFLEGIEVRPKEDKTIKRAKFCGFCL